MIYLECVLTGVEFVECVLFGRPAAYRVVQIGLLRYGGDSCHLMNVLSV